MRNTLFKVNGQLGIQFGVIDLNPGGSTGSDELSVGYGAEAKRGDLRIPDSSLNIKAGLFGVISVGRLSLGPLGFSARNGSESLSMPIPALA